MFSNHSKCFSFTFRIIQVIKFILLTYKSFSACLDEVQEEVLHYSRCQCLANVSMASVAQLDVSSDWRPGGHGFNPCRGRQHSFMEIDHEIFSTVILSLPLFHEGQLSVSGERMCTILVNHLEN